MPQKSRKSNADTELSLPKVDKQLAKVLRTIEKQTKQTSKAIKDQAKIGKQNARTIKTITKANKQMAKSSQQVSKQQAKMMKNLSKSTDRMKEQRRQVQQNIKTNKSFADSFLKIATVAAVAFAAIRKIGQIADARINVSILAPNLIKQIRDLRGQVTDAQLQLLNSVLGQSAATQFGIGRSPEAIEGLLKLQDKTIGLGREQSQRLIQQVQTSFGSNVERQQKFFEQLGRGDDVQAVIEQFATAQNIQSFDSLLNAIQTQREAAEGKADPLVQAAVKMKQSAEALRTAFESASDKIVDTLSPAITKAAESIVKAADAFSKSDISGGQLIGGGIGGLLLGGLALRGGRSLLGRGLGRVAGGIAGRAAPAVAGEAIPVIEGFAARRAAQATAGRVGASFVARGLAAAATAGKGITAAGVGSAALIGAPVAIGGAILRKPIKDREKLLEQTVDQIARNENQQANLFALAKERQRNATNEIDRLRGKRLEIDSVISGADPEGRNIEILREQRIKVVTEIKRLREKAQAQTPASTDATKKAEKATKELAKAMEQSTDQIKRNTDTSRLESLRQAAIAQQTLQLTIRERGSFTTIARQELEFAKLSPFGVLGAIPELTTLNKTIEREIGKLRELLATIDESETEGIIKANEIRGSINRLRIESKQQNIAFRDAMLSNTLGAAFAAGSFSKLLVRSGPLGVAQGLGQGLRQGIIGKNIPKFVTGSLTPQGNMPIFPRDLFPNLPTIPPSPQLPKRPRFISDPTAPPRAFMPPSPRQAIPIPQPQPNAPRIPLFPEPRVVIPQPPKSKAERRIQDQISQRENRIEALIVKQELIRESNMPDLESIGKLDRQIERAEHNNARDRERIIKILNRIAQGFGQPKKDTTLPALESGLQTVELPTMPTIPKMTMPEIPRVELPAMPTIPEMQLPAMPDMPTIPESIPRPSQVTIPDMPELEGPPLPESMKMPEIPQAIATPPIKIPELPEVEGPPLPESMKMPKLPKIPLFIFGEELEAAREKREALRNQERDLVTMGIKRPQANKKRATKPTSKDSASEQMKVVAATVMDVIPILREMESHIDLIEIDDLKPERVPLNRGGTNVNQ